MNLPDTLTATIRVLPSATMLVSRAGEIFLANSPAREALSLAHESPHEHNLTRLCDDPASVDEYLRMCSRSMSPIPGALRVLVSGAQPKIYLSKGALVAPRTDAQPALILLRLEPKDAGTPFLLLSQSIEGLSNEVKRRREAEAALRASQIELEKRVLEAERANRLKDEFLATLSHELRTPLNAILGWTNLIRDEGLTGERCQRGLEVIERNARIQIQLIEELLDISRIISGKLSLNVQAMDPIHVVEAAVESARPAADAKQIRLQCVLDPQAGPISGDPDRLQQVVWNLVSNALKFTPKGGRVQVLLERINSSIEISVIDTGRGIAPEFMPFVFDRFRQQEKATTRTHGGLGLGLAIAKNLVELHGGTIRVHSDGEGAGASFVVRLPRALLKPDPAPRPFASVTLTPRRSPPFPVEIAGLRILVVDDEPDALEMLVMRLEQCGAEARTASTARDALALVRAWRPDILISDIGLPEEDGYTLIQKVRALPPGEGGNLIAIALTAFARTEDRMRALTAGFQSHIPKPVDSGELFAIIASLAGRFSNRGDR